MAIPSGRSLGQEISSWLTAVGILIGASWGGYTFIYKEILLPSSAPVNISVDLQLKKVGQKAPNGAQVNDASDKPNGAQLNEASDRPNGAQGIEKKKQLIAVEIRFSAINPSPRDVYLLPSAWVAIGIVDKISDQELPDERAEKVLNEMPGEYIQKHSDFAELSVIAIGSLLPDDELRPNERAGRTEIIYVPAGRYDRIWVRAQLHTMSKKRKRLVQWKMQDKYPVLQLYRFGANNELIDISWSDDVEPDTYQIQYASGQISLWQEELNSGSVSYNDELARIHPSGR
jgi:hypothetical protein